MSVIPLNERLLEARNPSNALRYAFRDMVLVSVARQTFEQKLIELLDLRRDSHSSIPREALDSLFNSTPSIEDDPYEAVLTKSQYSILLDYLGKGDFYRVTDCGAIDKAEFVLAFSYGESPAVNSQIRLELEQLVASRSSSVPTVYAQWEIADMLPLTEAHVPTFYRIGMDPGEDYINSYRLVEKFKELANPGEAAIFLACQAWHGARCWRICEQKGLNVAGGLFVDRFSPNDPQPWVRDPLSWLIKES